jgi:hypothetical protein
VKTASTTGQAQASALCNKNHTEHRQFIAGKSIAPAGIIPFKNTLKYTLCTAYLKLNSTMKTTHTDSHGNMNSKGAARLGATVLQITACAMGYLTVRVA